MLVYQDDGVVQRLGLGRDMAVGSFPVNPLQIMQLGQQAFAQVARANADGVHLLHHVDSFAQGIAAERHPRRRGPRRNQRGTANFGRRRLGHSIVG